MGLIVVALATIKVLPDGQITLWRDYFDAATLVRVWPALATLFG